MKLTELFFLWRYQNKRGKIEKGEKNWKKKEDEINKNRSLERKKWKTKLKQKSSSCW